MQNNRSFMRQVLFSLVLLIGASVVAKQTRVQDFITYILAHPSAPLCEPFFIPTDKPLPLLLELIHNETQSIMAAMFNFTEPEIAAALLEAHERGVDIQVIVDVEGLRPRAERITYLYDNGIPVYFYAKYRSLMHNKYLIFAHTIGDRPMLWTGSANITKAGFNSNQENVIITSDLKLIESYQNAFQTTKQIIQKAKETKTGLRPYCTYSGNKLIVQLGKKKVRRFKSIF